MDAGNGDECALGVGGPPLSRDHLGLMTVRHPQLTRPLSCAQSASEAELVDSPQPDSARTMALALRPWLPNEPYGGLRHPKD